MIKRNLAQRPLSLGVRARRLAATVTQSALLLPFALHAGAQQGFVAVNAGAGISPLSSRAALTTIPAPYGSITGTVKDDSEGLVSGATVTLDREAPVPAQSTRAGSDGVFTFTGVEPGSYHLSVDAPGFSRWTRSATVGSGETVAVAEIALSLSSVNTAVQVSASATDVAAAQLGLEEKQRILGVFPNFYASYLPNAEPLTARQKVSLALHFSMDPVAFATAGALAGGEQARNTYSGYGRGAQGYAKRFGAAYTDGFTSTVLGGAVFPVVLHQDPRYFVKGTGSMPARALYAIASAVLCRGDNRRWQLNYSNVLGNAASAGISNLYYPSNDRHGAGLLLQNSLLATGFGALGNLMQEFVLHRMTPNVPDYNAATR